MYYAIGDIHGQCTMLREMLDTLRQCPLHEEDTLVFLGDYIDRGDDARGIIDMLIALKEQHKNVVFLRGNHEQMMLDARDSPPPERWKDTDNIVASTPTRMWLAGSGGGVDTLVSYKPDFNNEDLLTWWEFIPEAHWQFFRETELEFITERYHFVHAGLIPLGETWEHAGTDIDYRLWIREPFLSSDSEFEGRLVVFGHTPQKSGKPLVERNKIGIDTGAVFGGPLTAAVLEQIPTPEKWPVVRFIQIERR